MLSRVLSILTAMSSNQQMTVQGKIGLPYNLWRSIVMDEMSREKIGINAISLK